MRRTTIFLLFLIVFYCKGQSIDDCVSGSEELLSEEQLSDKSLKEFSML